MRTIYFHEDDYRQIELLPIENLDWCSEETARIEEFSREHRAGIGWTDVYRRKEPPLSLSSRGITRSEVHAAVCPILPAFDRVTTGYGSHEENADGAAAFGTESGFVAFVDFDGEKATAVWLTVEPSTADDLARAEAALNVFARWKLLLVDWAWCVVVPLDKREDVDAYLQQRRDAFGRSAESSEGTGWLARLRRWLGGGSKSA